MINEHTYFVGMTIISWMIAVFMLVGCIAVQAIKKDSEDEWLSDKKRDMAQMFMNVFDSKSLIDKVLSTIMYGALMLSIAFTSMFKKSNKGDNKK